MALTTEAATTATTAPARARSTRLAAMDALRLVAALAVVLFHFTARDHVRWGELPHEVFPGLSDVTRYGYAGVHLFFVISGFVILMSVWGRTVGEFVASRVSRLYPAFWAAVLITGALRWLWPSFDGRSPTEVAANLTMLHEPFGVPSVDGVYWTLWVEMQFYALVLVLVRLGLTRRRVLAAAAVVPAACTALSLAVPSAGADLTFLSWAPLFGAGMVLFVIHRDGHTRARWALVALNAGEAAAVAAGQRARAIDAVASGGTVRPVVLAAVVLGAVALVALVALVPAIRRVDLPVLTALGALTYPLYLTHEYVGWAVIQVLHPVLGRWGTLAAAVGSVLLLAWAIHRWVERPVQRPLRRWVLDRLAQTPSRRRQARWDFTATPSNPGTSARA
jgi:peptidoglycan/LPS O-acetylase OafA/YrhL